MYDSGAGSCSDIDIALAHPSSKEALKGSPTKDGSVAERKESAPSMKKKKVQGSQTSPNFIPLVFGGISK